MKKKFDSPTLELCEFVVAARLSGSGFSFASVHSGAPQSPCSKVPCMGAKSCSLPSVENSNIGNLTCAG